MAGYRRECRRDRGALSIFRLFTIFFVFVAVKGCGVVNTHTPWERDYDPTYGLEQEDIRKHFNLHRGRWWNYYSRGSWHLACGHFEAAREDFSKALEKRSRDKRNARTYGMHFIDYFPHRESGIAFFLEGDGQIDAATKKKRFNQAIEKLKISLDQEESSRAKFYSNQARKALWMTIGGDTTPPKINVETLVYTNRPTVQFKVKVTDYQSYVGQIQVGDENLPVELARSEVYKDVQLPIGTDDGKCTITIQAVDLVGNSSQANVHVIIDTSNPLISVNVHENKVSANGQIPIDFAAADNVGLKRIQVSEDPSAVVLCKGERYNRGRIWAKPKEGKLTIEVLDNANNASRARVNNLHTLGLAHVRGLDDYRVSALGSDRSFWWIRAEPRRFLRAISFGPTATYRTSDLTLAPQAAPFLSLTAWRLNRWGPVYSSLGNSPTFWFENGEDLRGDGYPVSGKTYIVHGTLINADRLTSITVEDQPVQQVEAGEYVGFSHRVKIDDMNNEDTKTISVKASFGRVRPLEVLLKIRKVPDCMTDPNSVYTVVLLPLVERHTAMDPYGDNRDPNRAHSQILALLKESTAYGPEGQSYERFRVVDGSASEIGSEIKSNGIKKKYSDSYKALLIGENLEADLAIYGDIVEHQKGYEITLRTVDVTSGRILVFPGREAKDRTEVLADIYGDKENYSWWIRVLVSKIKERFPRLRAEFTPTYKRKIGMPLGHEDRIFDHMKLRVYRRKRLGHATGQHVSDAQARDVELNRSEVNVERPSVRKQLRSEQSYYFMITK